MHNSNYRSGSRFMSGGSLSRRLALIILGLGNIWTATARADDRPRGPDVVRPTVQLRNGDHRGSGTVIVSIPDETWILTAAHVVEKASEVKVELHRFNLGSQLTALTEGNGWPRLVPATVEVTDPDSDVALVRIKGMVRLPFVARLELAADEPATGEFLTSVGIDRGLHLTSWHTSVKNAFMVDLGKGGGPRRFTITSRPPDHGRSGGGLFRSDGVVVGVCTGQLGSAKGQQLGIFASMASIRTLVQKQALEKTVRSPVHPLQ